MLDALVYRDARQMWTLLAPASRTGLTPETFAAAVDALPIVAESAEIESIEPREGRIAVRYRLRGVHPTSGAAVNLPGTMEVLSTSPQCAVALRLPRAPGSAANESEFGSVADASRTSVAALPESQVIDGLTAQDVLDRAVAATGQIESLRMGVTVQSGMMGQANTMRGEFLYLAPNRLRFDLGEVLFVTDGVSAYLQLEAANAHMRLPSSFSSELVGFAPGLGGAGADMQASLIAREPVGDRPAYHLALASPRSSSSSGALGMLGSMGPTHVWLDAETYLPLRTHAGVMGMTMDLTFDSVTLNPPDISPDAFTFRPQPGSMELPMMFNLGGG
jgi:outer membrane lipoprotein-sorting protein